MTKYYVNGKQISKQEANEIKKENARLQKSTDLPVGHSMDYRDKQIKVNKAITVNLHKASVVYII